MATRKPPNGNPSDSHGSPSHHLNKRNLPLAVLLDRLAPVLRGWTNYFRHGVSKATFDYLRHYAWRRVIEWLRRKHPDRNWKWIRSHYLPDWWPTDGRTKLFDPGKVTVTRYRYRGENIPTPWSAAQRQPIPSA